ncbi:MAG: polysaccharide biosynthesis/export family protein [Planctomycetes bacterium]|nr:polysaccharide biosynthesis/export family protein [Planctomycetota bacterium]
MAGRWVIILAVVCILASCQGFYGRRGNWDDMTEPESPGPLLSDCTEKVPYDELFVYKVGNGDGLRLKVTGHKELSAATSVDQRGHMALPGTDEILAVEGLSLDEVQALVSDAISRYVIGRPKVRVSLVASASRYYYVIGGVRHPGVYRMGARVLRLREALAIAGFFREYMADKKRVGIITPDPVRPTHLIANGKQVLMGKEKYNAVIKPGDVIFVQSSVIYDVDKFLHMIFRQTENVSTTNEVVEFWEDAAHGEFGSFTYPRDAITVIY